MSMYEMYEWVGATRWAGADQGEIERTRMERWRNEWARKMGLLKELKEAGVLDDIAEVTGQRIEIVEESGRETVAYPPRAVGLDGIRWHVWVEVPKPSAPQWDPALEIRIWPVVDVGKPYAVLSYLPEEGLTIIGRGSIIEGKSKPPLTPKVQSGEVRKQLIEALSRAKAPQHSLHPQPSWQ